MAELRMTTRLLALLAHRVRGVAVDEGVQLRRRVQVPLAVTGQTLRT